MTRVKPLVMEKAYIESQVGYLSRALWVLISISILVLSLLPAPVHGTTIVMLPDESLYDQAELVVVGEILSRETQSDSAWIMTDYTVLVERVVKGQETGWSILVRVPGGTLPDGSGLMIHGAPDFAVGQRTILFLEQNPDDSYGTLHLSMGAFKEVFTKSGKSALVREFADVSQVSLSKNTITMKPENNVRDFDKFLKWLENHALGFDADSNYMTFEPLSPRDPGPSKYSYFQDSSGRRIRWFNFDRGESVPWHAYQAGVSGLDGGGFGEFQTALNAWNGDSGSNINYQYVGRNGATTGFQAPDGVNSILFDDPNGQLSGSFNCFDGGVLAIGGFWFSEVEDYKGNAHRVIFEADIITQDGAGCLLAGWNRKNAAEVFAHELGHTLGIDHSSNANALMYPIAHADGRGAQLHQDDINAIRVLYSSSAPNTEPEPANPTGPPGPVTLLSPSGAIEGNVPTLTWQSLAEATGYYVYMEGPGGYKYEKVYGANAITSGGTCSVTMPEALSDGTYSWLVHGGNPHGYGPWVQPLSFTVNTQGGGGTPQTPSGGGETPETPSGGSDPQPPANEPGPTAAPGPATLLSPSGSISDSTPTLTWQRLDGAGGYYVYIEGSGGYRYEKVYGANAITSGNTCSVTVPNALANGTYKWLVHGGNKHGYGPWVQPLSFTVSSNGGGGQTPQEPRDNPTPNGPPAAATLISPSGSISDNTPTLTWQALSSATGYYVYIEGPGGYRHEKVYGANAVTSGNSCSVTVPNALANGTYRWLVHGGNPHGFGPWVQPLSFTVTSQGGSGGTPQEPEGASGNGAPGPATLLTPSGTIGTGDPTFAWEALPTATDYYIYIEGTGGYRYEQMYSASAITSGDICSVSLPNPLANGSYIWIVHGYNENGFGPWVNPLAFRVVQ